MADSTTADNGRGHVMGRVLGTEGAGRCPYRGCDQFHFNLDRAPFRARQPVATASIYDAAGLFYSSLHLAGVPGIDRGGVNVLPFFNKP